METSGLTDLIGTELIDKEGKPVVLPQLPADGALAIYFSAHWCPPCRGFTPKLVEFYQKYKETEAGSRLEVVFVSSDQDETAFKEYHSEMPWPALPYTDRARKEKLSTKYKVRGIPTLVIVDPSGKLITSSGREGVAQDPEGKEFPWRPVPVSQMLASGKLLKSGSSELIDVKEALDGKIKGLYFSAHWCPPCRGFTPTLVETYNKLRAANKNFEIVFVSSDRDEQSMKEYFADMPWLAVPYDDPRQDKLSSVFGIRGIPTLVILDENNEVITTEGRPAVDSDPEGLKFPWVPEPCQQLSSDTAGALNSSPCFILMTDNKEDLVKQAKDILTPVASEYRAQLKAAKDDEMPDVHFFYEGPESVDIVDQLKSLLPLGGGDDDAAPAPPRIRYVILDIGEQHFHAVTWPSDDTDPLAENGEATLRQLVDDLKHGRVAFKPLAESDD